MRGSVMYQRLHFDLIIGLLAGLVVLAFLFASNSAAAFDFVKIQINGDSIDAEIIRVIRTDSPIWSAEDGFAFSWVVEPKRKADGVVFEVPPMFREVAEPAQDAPIILAPLGTPCSFQPGTASRSF